MATDDDLAAIAAELYSAPLAEFTATRTARVKAARDDGDRDLAARIGALPKPSASAWLVDLLAREHADDLDRLDDLGARLRTAQEAPDGARLRELGTERRALLAELAGIAADRSEESGRRASAAVVEEIQQTLQAALSDESAATAVRSGRLVRALVVEGLDPVDLTNAVAVGGRLPPARPAKRGAVAAPAAPERDDAAERLKAAEARVAQAERAAKGARQDADDAASAASDADALARQRAADAKALHKRLEDLQRQVDSADADLAHAEEAAGTAREAADDAAEVAERAEQEADAAANDLRGLTG